MFACPVRAQAVDSTVASADATYTAKQYDQAIIEYQDLESSATTPDVKAYAHSQLAECYGKKGDHAKARKLLMEVADTYPDQVKAVAMALLRTGDYALADADLAGSTIPYDLYCRGQHWDQHPRPLRQPR